MFSACESSNAGSGNENPVSTHSAEDRAHQMTGNVIVDVARLLAAMLESDTVESSEVTP